MSASSVASNQLSEKNVQELTAKVLKNDDKAAYKLYLHFKSKSNPLQAQQYLYHSAEKGNPDAQFALGKELVTGKQFGDIDRERAFRILYYLKIDKHIEITKVVY